MSSTLHCGLTAIFADAFLELLGELGVAFLLGDDLPPLPLDFFFCKINKNLWFGKTRNIIRPTYH